MVLFELGQKLESAMKKMQATHVVDEEVVSQLLQEIARALLEVHDSKRPVFKLCVSSSFLPMRQTCLTTML